MSTTLKWVLAFLTVLFLVFFIVYTATVQNTAVRTTSEIEALAENLSVGLIRSEIEESDEGYPFFDKEEVIANLVTNVANVQKNHRYDIDLQYVFLDKNGNITETESEMRGVQFVVQYLSEKGEVKASAEKRITLDTLSK